jgi:hypothetical protein
MPKYAVQPALIPDARLVRRLEAQLSPQPMTLEAIAKMLAYDENTRPAEEYVLRALQDLEERGLAKRISGKGWAKDNKLFGKEV